METHSRKDEDNQKDEDNRKDEDNQKDVPAPGKEGQPPGPDQHEPQGGKGQGRRNNVQMDPDDQRKGADPERHRP